uniref:Transmembrane protein n=1 Tax=Tanacetum cinerariifolium TaxID=118510 RepID=A0A6L2KRT8_TANCI|nr:uncharacterized protein [Tanacetum cinerariifolium]
MIKESDPIGDIESTGSECKDDPINEHVTNNKRAKNVLRTLVGALSCKGSDDGEDSSNFRRNSVTVSDDEYNDIEASINNKSEAEKRERVPLIDKLQLKEKHKTRNSKKAPKPPRPRKGPSLSTNDLRLVKEISELVMKKRARFERMKSLKKMRAVRSPSSQSSSSSSSSISIFAMLITVLFLIVIIFQGFSSSKGLTSSHQVQEQVV